MKNKKGLILSIIVGLALIVVPISVKLVLDQTLMRSEAEVDSGAATSYRVAIEAEESKSPVLQVVDENIPEIAAGVIFIWMVSILLWVGLKKRKDEVVK
jgi:hypothetical protein